MKKNSKKLHKYKTVPEKKIPEWFIITIINPIHFMKMLWYISANIGSGLA